jgi:hypothetical protein
LRGGWPPAIAGGCYLLVAVAVTALLWRDPAVRITAGNPHDADQAAWFMRYGSTAISHLRLPRIVTTKLGAPTGVNLMWNTPIFLLSLLLSPVTLLWGPQVSLTLVLTLGFAGSAFALFWVLRSWGCGVGAAFAGGLVYGFSPALAQSAVDHYDLQFAVFAPLIADAALRLLVGRGRPLWVGAWLGLLCAAQVLTDEEIGFDIVLAVAVLALVLAVSRPSYVAGRVRDVATGLIAAAAVAAAAVGYPLWEQFAGSLRQSGSASPVNYFKNDLYGLVQPSSIMLLHTASSAAFASRFIGRSPEYLGYLGWPILLALLAATVACWHLLAARLAAVTFIVLEVCSLGGTLLANGHVYSWLKLPWYWLQSLPLAGSVLPDRFSILADGAAAALLAFAADWAWRSFSQRAARAATVAAVVLATLPLMPAPLPAANASPIPPGWTQAFTALALPAGATVLTVPVPTSKFTEPMRWQADTGMPSALVGGYFVGPKANGQAHFGGLGEVTEARYLNLLWAESGGTFPAGFGAAASGIEALGRIPDAQQARRQLSAWHSAAVLAVTSPTSRLGKYLISLLGPPSVKVDNVLGWRLPAL